MYQCKVDVDMLNAVKSVLADVSSVSPSSEHIYINLTLIHCTTLTLVPEVFRKATKKTSGNSGTDLTSMQLTAVKYVTGVMTPLTNHCQSVITIPPITNIGVAQ